MQENKIVGVPIYEFICDSNLVDNVIDIVKKLDYTTNSKNSISITKTFYHEQLFSWFDQCLESVRKKYYIDGVKLDIVSCWANRSNVAQAHHQHMHYNSIISGIFYLTEGKGGETYFYAEDPWVKLGNLLLVTHEGESKPRMLKSSVTPKKGKLLLFPSNLQHSVAVNKDLSPRYTISFNTFFSGDLTNGNDTIRLKISCESVSSNNLSK